MRYVGGFDVGTARRVSRVISSFGAVFFFHALHVRRWWLSKDDSMGGREEELVPEEIGSNGQVPFFFLQFVFNRILVPSR